jgi:hypothetical protein
MVWEGAKGDAAAREGEEWGRMTAVFFSGGAA